MFGVIRRAIGTIWLPIVVSSVFLFFYIPIIVLITFSFNDADFPYRWSGFSLKWYKVLFQSSEIWLVLKNSLLIASCATLLSLVMGLLLVFYASKTLRRYFVLFYSNLIFPEIVLAVGLLSFFTYWAVPLTLVTLIAGHTILGLGYVIPILSSRFNELETSVIEASLDLGATIHQTFFRVVIPSLFPAIIASGLLVFVVSFDDFLLAFFLASGSSQTLPLYIFSLIRSGISPDINALSTIIILVSSLFVVFFCLFRSRIRIF